MKSENKKDNIVSDPNLKNRNKTGKVTSEVSVVNKKERDNVESNKKNKKIQKGSIVRVLTGNDRNKIGRVISVDYKKLKVTVEGVNIRTKHAKPTQTNPQGGIIKLEMPIHYSNVCNNSKKEKTNS